MGVFAGLWMILLGVLGAANLIIARKPEAKEIIGKISPYQGWIGAISAVWGVIVIIHALLNLDWFSDVPLWWLTYMAEGVLLFCLGMLLGVGTIKSFVKQPTAVEKMDQLVAKLAPSQGKLGVVAIGVGIWGVIAALTWL